MPQKWQDWLAQQRAESQMTAEEVPLHSIFGDEERDWQNVDGNVARGDGAFFSVVGAQISLNEQISWPQPLLKESAPGVCIVILDDLYRALIQAKAEPGNIHQRGHILLAPTLQASKSNLEGSGKAKVPRGELVDLLHEDRAIMQAKDGGRYLGKRNMHGVLRYTDPAVHDGTPLPNERWFTKAELMEAYWVGECNEHLVELIPGILSPKPI